MAIETFSFGLKDVKIAAWNSPENYGTAVDLVSANMYGIRFNTVSGQLEGDDEITDTHAKIISAQIRVRFAFRDLTAFATVTGTQVVESLPDTKSIKIDTTNMPYVAINGRIDHTQGTGSYEFFIPKCKLMEGFELGFQYGQYVTPELTMTAIREGDTYGLGKIIARATAVAVAIPPAPAAS